MNDATLVGYLLGALEPGECRKVADYLQTDPAARARLEALRRALEPLAADRDEPEPPPGLARRTLARLAESSPLGLPRAPKAGTAVGAGFPVWRRADILVAACLLLTALGLLSTWLLTLHRPDGAAAVTACQDNLRRFYVGLKNYSDLHNRELPNVARAADSPKNVAGLVVPMLLDAGTLSEPVSVRCPASGPAQPCRWTLGDLRAMTPEQFRRNVDTLAASYAYTLGYAAENQVVGLRFDAEKPTANIPVMADCPPADASAGNSPNHGGAGQNVLFMDGHVQFCSTRTVGVGGDDIFLNRAARVAAGLDWQDAVLGRSSACPAP